MLFNSIEFLLFFPIVTGMYFCVPHRARWVLLLLASYFFYMSWKPAYALLLVVSTLVDYACAVKMSAAPTQVRRKLFLAISLASNLGLLFTFKYLNFFAWSVHWLLDAEQAAQAGPFLDVLLPVGISFYTFQTLSYSIDVYRNHRAPERRLGHFALYVSFFPQLVAGPIERSTTLLPQFDHPVAFDTERVFAGLRLMLWGMFKKVVVADSLATIVDPIFAQPDAYGGPAIVLGTWLFAIQILCDFSGYSDIAIGAAHVLGFSLMENFRHPYRSASLREFWQRWHISLSSWFRDYCYIPLGGSRAGAGRTAVVLLVVFLLSGLWHGANWTFVLWGLWHASFLIAERAAGPAIESLATRTRVARLPRLRRSIGVAVTFALVCVGWILFRAESVSSAFVLLSRLSTGWGSFLASPGLHAPFDSPAPLGVAAAAITLMMVAQAAIKDIGKRTDISASPRALRWLVYYSLLASLVLFFGLSDQDFIYFQF